MAKKTAQIPSKPTRVNADTDPDEWVKDDVVAKPARSATKRLTLDLSEDLHRRVKLACTARGSTMVEEITKLLEKEFRT